jgi:PAS domain-containing protein
MELAVKTSTQDSSPESGAHRVANAGEAEALRESEQRYSTIFEVAPFPISLTRLPAGDLVSANGAFVDLFGFSRAEIIGRDGLSFGISDSQSQSCIRAELEAHG